MTSLCDWNVAHGALSESFLVTGYSEFMVQSRESLDVVHWSKNLVLN